MSNFPVGRIVQWMMENCSGCSVTYDGRTDNLIIHEGGFGFVITRKYVESYPLMHVYHQIREGWKAIKQQRSTAQISIRPVHQLEREGAGSTSFDT